MLVGEPPVLKSYIACAGIYHQEEFPVSFSVSFSVSVSVSFAFFLFSFSFDLCFIFCQHSKGNNATGYR